jgi:hypothetical protein
MEMNVAKCATASHLIDGNNHRCTPDQGLIFPYSQAKVIVLLAVSMSLVCWKFVVVGLLRQISWDIVATFNAAGVSKLAFSIATRR